MFQVTVERLESELSNYHQEKVRAEDMTSQKVESVQAENESLRQKLGAQADTHTVSHRGLQVCFRQCKMILIFVFNVMTGMKMRPDSSYFRAI